MALPSDLVGAPAPHAGPVVAASVSSPQPRPDPGTPQWEDYLATASGSALVALIEDLDWPGGNKYTHEALIRDIFWCATEYSEALCRLILKVVPSTWVWAELEQVFRTRSCHRFYMRPPGRKRVFASDALRSAASRMLSLDLTMALRLRTGRDAASDAFNAGCILGSDPCIIAAFDRLTHADPNDLTIREIEVCLLARQIPLFWLRRTRRLLDKAARARGADVVKTARVRLGLHPGMDNRPLLEHLSAAHSPHPHIYIALLNRPFFSLPEAVRSRLFCLASRSPLGPDATSVHLFFEHCSPGDITRLLGLLLPGPLGHASFEVAHHLRVAPLATLSAVPLDTWLSMLAHPCQDIRLAGMEVMGRLKAAASGACS